MTMGKARRAAALLAASALLTPGAAFAASARERALEARLERLEAQMTAMQEQLASARAGQAEAVAAAAQASAAANAAAEQARLASAEAGSASGKVAALERKPAADGMKVGAATIKLGGYLKLVATRSRFHEGEVAANSFGADFYLPQSIPVGTGVPSTMQDFTAKQSRFWLNVAADVAGHSVKGYLETDFQAAPGTQGSLRTTNAYNLALRRAYMQVDRWTFGQDWTTFQYTGALPESTDYVGATEGTVFERQPLIRYSQPLSKELTLHLAAENNATGLSAAGAPALVEGSKGEMPDLVARLAYAGKPGELSLAVLGRQVRFENAGVSASRAGFGASFAGKLFLDDAKLSDIRFMATYGRNIGRYVGLNFAPDAVYVAGTNRLESVDVFAAMAAARIALDAKLRINLIGSYQSVDYADALALAGLANFNKRAWSGAVNLFYSPFKQVDLGIEYRHGERKVVSGASGALDRVEFAAKYSF